MSWNRRLGIPEEDEEEQEPGGRKQKAR